MSTIRYEPWTLMDRLHRDLDRLFSARYGDESEEPAAVADWIPAVDIKEDDKQFVLWADLPGVDAEDVEVTMENGLLSIQGKRDTETSAGRTGYRRVERPSGRFLRRFSLPDGADERSITARNRNGILEIVIPKQPQQLARKIKVSAGRAASPRGGSGPPLPAGNATLSGPSASNRGV